VIAVQLIDSAGRVLGTMRLPAGVRLADLEQLALAADQSQPERRVANIGAEVSASTLEAGVMA